jgi:hypothetical protein
MKGHNAGPRDTTNPMTDRSTTLTTKDYKPVETNRVQKVQLTFAHSGSVVDDKGRNIFVVTHDC